MSGKVAVQHALATAPREAARRHPGTPITLDRPLALFPEAGTSLTFALFHDMTERAARMLAAAGVREGVRVLILRQESLDTPLLAFACARLGAIPVLVHPSVPPAAVSVLARRADPGVVVTDVSTEATGVLDDVPGPRWYVGQAGGGGASLADAPDVRLPEPAVPPSGAGQLVTHSSGTTGVPKLVLHSVGSFAGHARPQIFLGRVLRVHDPYLMCLSCVHARTMSGLLTVLALGLPTGFATDPDPRSILELIGRVRPGVVETVPNAFVRWEELAQLDPGCLASVRMFLSSFDAAHPRTIEAMLAMARPGARYLQAYGQTESGPVTVKVHRLRGGGCHDSRCVGRPVFGHTRIRVCGEDGDRTGRGTPGRRAGRGTPGQVLAWSAGVCPSYLGGDIDVRDQRSGKWWRMGDYGVVTRRGCLHLLDRITDRVPGTQSLLAAEDTIMRRLPELTEAAFIPMTPDPPVPLVCTRGDQPLSAAAWRQATADLEIGGEPVQCRWEDIPHTATWKVRRSEAARLLREGTLSTLAGRS
jgi:acyl-coenzyme A synthetase/AMP-(fatty) acid ligase